MPNTPQMDEFFKELEASVAVSAELSTVATRHSIRSVLLAMGLMLGTQAKDDAELKQFLSVVNSVAASHRQALAEMLNETNPQGHA